LGNRGKGFCAQSCPDALIRKRPVAADVECRESTGKRLGHDQCLSVGRACHAVGKIDAASDFAPLTVWSNQDQFGQSHLRIVRMPSEVTDVGVTTLINQQVVALVWSRGAQIDRF
jgi:hypothetical protein